MKKAFWILLFFAIHSCLFSQYYLHGEVRDEKGRLLPDVKIYLQSKGTVPFSSGSSGLFGINSSLQVDTITLCSNGYAVLRKPISTIQYQVLILKMLPANASRMIHKLSSKTVNLITDNNLRFSDLGESYSSLSENNFITAAVYPETGFVINVDRASYSNIRRFLMNEMTVPVDAVRIEEMLNYFDLRSNKTTDDSRKFECQTTLTSCPWNKENQLLFININAPKLNLDSVASSNLVFLIDVSGSMERPNRLPLLQTAFKLLVENLRQKDTVTIVTYGGGVNVPLSATSGAEKQKINNVLDSLYADGDTPGEGAIRTAYTMAKRSFIKNGNNRIILATDGDFNVGQTSEKDLEDLVIFQRQSGIYLTCLGVGMGNYKDSKLETLATKGNGNFAYLDNIAEAEKVLVTEFTKTIYSVANDAFTTVTFNPGLVKSYRIIGYDNKKEEAGDQSDELEGGEVGSGHFTTAIFEITRGENTIDSAVNLAQLTLQYRLPGNDTAIVYQKFSVNGLARNFESAPDKIKFATAVTMFGTLLKHSKYARSYTYNDVLALALQCADMTSPIQQEFITLVQKARKLNNYRKKRR